MSKVGIYSGSFDPVHAGHIAFALQAKKSAHLDKLYFLPERRPRHKDQVEHFAHRVGMLRQAIKPYPEFKILELTDISFSIERTLAKLEIIFRGDELVFLFGSDVISHIPDWPKHERLLRNCGIVIGLRQQDSKSHVKQVVKSWAMSPKGVTIVSSYMPQVSSSHIREALRSNKSAVGILKSVERYSSRNWLYVSLVRS